MGPFDHFTPESLPEALQLLASLNGTGRVIAGGTDLILQMRNGLIAPPAIINIKNLGELKGMSFESRSGLKLGALKTLRELNRSPLVRSHYPALSCTTGQMASEQIRGFATVGGNLCNGSPSADTAPPLIAMKASVSLVNPDGERWLSVEDLFLGPGETAVAPGELLTQIWIPPPEGKTIFLKHAPRVFMDISVVCVAVNLQAEGDICRAARVVLGAVAPTPLRARETETYLAAGPLTPDRIQQAAKIASAECNPIDDVKGSAWYRKRMVEVLVSRGLSALVK